jgi:hypothetical protein
VIAKLAESGGTVFTSMDVLPVPGTGTLRTLALRMRFLNRKRGPRSALGLNYRFIGSSQPPSRDTVTVFVLGKVRKIG